MYRTAQIAATDETELFPAVMTAWNASPMTNVPSIVIKRLLMITITTNASCTVAFRRTTSEQYNVFILDPGDEATINVADVGLDITTPATQCSLRSKSADAAVIPNIKLTALVSTD